MPSPPSTTLASRLLSGIASLHATLGDTTDSISAAAALLGAGGGSSAAAIAAGVDPAAPARARDAFAHAAGLALRQRLARALLYLFLSHAPTCDSGGHGAVLAAGGLAGAPRAPAAPLAGDGGELLLLLLALRAAGDGLYGSVDHGDGNPLWELAWTLLAALFAGLDCARAGGAGEPDKELAGDEAAREALAAARARGQAGLLAPALAHAMLAARAREEERAPRAAGAGAGAGRAPAPAPLAAGYALLRAAAAPSGWLHGGLAGGAGLALGLWAFSCLRFEPGRERASPPGASEAEDDDAALKPWPSPLRPAPCWDDR